MLIIEDLKAFSNGSYIKMIVTIFTNPCFHSVLLYRLSSLLYKIHLSPISKIIWYINRVVYNVDIDYRADLAGGFVIVHGLGVVIESGVKSNGKLKVYQGVTIGGTGKYILDSNNNKIYMPIIEDNVVIYTDAKVLGPVYIQENTIIKSSSIIIKDIKSK